MIEGIDGFPPFDDSLRPSADAHGQQLTPETFVRWVIPGAWEDAAGDVHFDVHVFHEWLGLEMTEASIRETTAMFAIMLEQHLAADPSAREHVVIVRP